MKFTFAFLFALRHVYRSDPKKQLSKIQTKKMESTLRPESCDTGGKGIESIG